MRNIGNLQSRLRYLTDRDAHGVAKTRPNPPVEERNLPVSDAAEYRRYERHGNNGGTGSKKAERRNRLSNDRRNYEAGKVSTSMMVEFRNGRDRRRTTQRGNEIVTRIDEKV